MAFNYSDISEKHLNEHIDNIISILKQIPLNKVTILTGGNALGKSVIRKQLPFSIQEKLEDSGVPKENIDIRHLVASTSMQLRTELRSEWGALAAAAHDSPWEATSICSISNINYLLGQDIENSNNKRFCVIDELEIGMSLEVQVGTCQRLNSIIPSILDKTYGILVITHSPEVVKSLNHDLFLNMEGLSEEQWINRPIEPVFPEVLKKWAQELSRAITNREHSVND